LVVALDKGFLALSEKSMNTKNLTRSANSLSKRLAPPGIILGIPILLVVMLGGCRSLWLSRDDISTGDFKRIRSALETDVPELFTEATEEFVKGGNLYALDAQVAGDRYNILWLYIVQFEAVDGTAYEVLFAFTSGPRGFGEGYYYAPSGKLPLWAPTYGVICSKQLDGPWYAFRTVDSSVPPDPKHCPEDTQYQQ
jgi:hypothetical protein